MTVRRTLFLLFFALILMSGIAAVWRPQRTNDGRMDLVWVSDSNPARLEQIAAFNEQNPSHHLLLDKGNSGTQKIILQSASGVGPDIFDFNDEDLGTFVEAGILQDVTDAARKGKFSAKADLWPTGRNTVTYQGRQYGYPCNIGSAILVYNKNVFDRLGVSYPEANMTWDDFVALATKIRSASQQEVFPISGATWRIFFENLRGEFFREDGSLFVEESPVLIRAFQMHRDFLFKYRFMPTSLEARSMSGQGGWGSGNLNQFSSGRFAMIITGHWALISFERAHRQKEASEAGRKDGPLRIGAVLIPRFADHPPSYRIQSRVAGINAGSPRRDEAIAFLQYLAGPTYSKLLNEGTDWLPGNPAYANLGVSEGIPDLSRTELQHTTEMAVSHGYVPRRSPFLLTSDVIRVLTTQISRMESNPGVPIESLLKTAEAELKTLMRRNLERNPQLRSLFIERFGDRAFENLRPATS